MTTTEKNWIETEWEGQTYVVPVTGRDENLNAMLTEIPSVDPEFTRYAMAFLMQDGNLAVPGGRYGTDTISCAPVAIVLAKIMQYHNGEPITYYQLDSDMGLVVNSADDVAYMIFEYGELALGDDFEVSNYISEADVEEARERRIAEFGDN